jgi:hypothetical protein
LTRLPRPALAFCALLLAFAAGCGGRVGTLAQPTPLGPDEILARSLARLETSASFHFAATVSGSVKAGSLGSLLGGIPIGLLGNLKLDGASMTGDVDVANRALRSSASFPALFGLTAEIVLVDGYAYTQVNLLGDRFTKSKAPASLPVASPGANASLGFRDTVSQIRSVLESSGTTATLTERGTVDGLDAYHLVVTVPAEGVNRLVQEAGGAAAAGLAFQIAPFDYWVYHDALQPARLELKASSATIGTIDLDLTLTGYDQPVKIVAPPASKVNGT